MEKKIEKNKRVYLVDGSSYIYRAFYALKSLSNSKGEPTNAVFGFARMLITLLKKESPDYLAIAFDPRGKTFRHEVFTEYKANRSAMPEDLSRQIPDIHRFVSAFNVKSFIVDGMEADDVIGTLTSRAVSEGYQVTIVSGDKDFMQLVSSDVLMFDTMKNKVTGVGEVQEKFGVRPEKVIDVMGLTGDSSDNIPGVPGIGIKTAVKLIAEYGSIENLIESVEKISQKSVREKIAKNSQMARLSRELVTIKVDAPVDCEISALQREDFHSEELRAFLKQMEFPSLIKELGLFPRKGVEGVHRAQERKYAVLKSGSTLSVLLEESKSSGRVAIRIFENLGTNGGPFGAMALTPKKGTGYLLSFQNEKNEELFESLRPLFEDPCISKICHDMKPVLKLFKKMRIDLKGPLFDTMIASYLLRPTQGTHPFPDVLAFYLGSGFREEVLSEEERMQAAPENNSESVCVFSDSVFSLSEKLSDHLKKEGLDDLFNTIEMPVLEVISKIEDNGVFIDSNALAELSARLTKRLAEKERDIFVYAGESFNINSPKQLAEILFTKLKLKATKKTKTGFSTDNSVLESLSGSHPLPGSIIEYRQIMKIKSTYADALPKMINENTGRVHTSYNQTVTATGRLSSTEPNLQNIPIRSSLGNEIRRAFVAKKGWTLLSADYSQVELRLLAHLAGDPSLIDAFSKGEDIHRRTASEIFQVDPLLVTSEMRRMAKTINFGIIYGMGAHGLSKSLGRSRKEAALFLEKYFSMYSGVQGFIRKSIEDARADGFVKTLFGRRRSIPDLNSSNRNLRELAERIAVNTRIQGTAADILKVAMISINRSFEKKGLESTMIMQVHDELVFEVLDGELTEVEEIVKREMEGVITLLVPLTVDFSVGNSWDKDTTA